MSGSSDRLYIAVPYEERDKVKALGARWDREAKSWYIPADKNSHAFDRWRPDSEVSLAADPRKQFADELRRAGFRLGGQHPMMDGKIHRVPVEGDKGIEKNGSYRGFLDGVPNGWHQNFKTTEKPVPWKASGGQSLSAAERADLAAVSATNRRDAHQQREQEAYIASQKAIEILDAASPARSHAYLTAKQVRGHGLFIAATGTTIESESGKDIDITGRLLVPIRSTAGNVVSLQIIDDQGGKMFLRGGKVAGGQHVIGDDKSPWPLMIAEGYATAVSVHEATGHAVVVAFNAHNLGLVAAQQRAAAPERSIVIAGDNDHHLTLQTDGQGRQKRNVGKDAAIAAANAIDGTALIPDFASGERGTDWNDALKARGLDAVRAELSVGLARAAQQKIAKHMEQVRCCRQDRERVREDALER
jgi:phage/plasmid primase-like uncharacterized protein